MSKETVFFIIGGSALIYFVLYLLYSNINKSYINCLTPSLIYYFPILFILEPINIANNGLSGTVFAYSVIYCTAIFSFAAFILGLQINIKDGISSNQGARKIDYSIFPSFIFVLIALLLYAPILFEFKNYLLNPRLVYSATRVGFGPSFFLSLVFSNLAIISLFFINKKYLSKLVIISLSSLIIFMHGGKGPVVAIILQFLIFNVYVNNYRYLFFKSLIILFLLSFLIITLFYIFYPGIDLSDLVFEISNYSDFNRNAMLVIDDNKEILLGQLTIGEQFWSRIPRFLFDDKPHDFGAFYLAKLYFPDAFYGMQGAPAFGVMGVLYADFSFLAPFIIIILSLISGILSKYFINKLRFSKNIFLFIGLLFFSSVPLFSMGSGYLLPENLLLGFVALKIINFFSPGDLCLKKIS